MLLGKLYDTLNSPTQTFGNFMCTVDNTTFNPSHVCTNLKTGVSTVGFSSKGSFHVEGQELPLIDKWPGIADCLGKDHGDKCWRSWDV